MVQRYEQMRRLQWYKCGAAYRFWVIYHVFLVNIMQKMLDSFTSKAKLLADGAEVGLGRFGLFHRMKQSVSPLEPNSFVV